jgi:hypothetical protein
MLRWHVLAERISHDSLHGQCTTMVCFHGAGLRLHWGCGLPWLFLSIVQVALYEALQGFVSCRCVVMTLRLFRKVKKSKLCFVRFV